MKNDFIVIYKNYFDTYGEQFGAFQVFLNLKNFSSINDKNHIFLNITKNKKKYQGCQRLQETYLVNILKGAKKANK